MSEELKSAREFAEAVAEWVQGGSPLDDVAVEHLAGFIISRDKLIEEAAFRKAASYLRGLRKTPGGFDLYHTEMQVLAKVADGLERASLSILLSAPSALAAREAEAFHNALECLVDEIETGELLTPKLKAALAEHDREIERKARLAFYAEIMSLRCEPLGRLGMVQALKENKAAPSTSSVSGTKEGKEAISIEEAKAITNGYPPSSGPGRSDE